MVWYHLVLCHTVSYCTYVTSLQKRNKQKNTGNYKVNSSPVD